jgi:hypothetical protein
MSVTEDIQNAANPKLPLWHTVSLSYSTFFAHFKDVLQISWLWLLVVTPLTGATSWLQMSWMGEVIANSKRGVPPQIPAKPIDMMVLGNASTLAILFAGVSIAVAWHRRLILGEHPGFSGSNIASSNLWRYIGIGILICLIVAIPALVIIVPIFFWVLPQTTGTTVVPVNSSIFPIIILVFLIYIVAFAVILRLSLLLPARAVRDLTLTFKGAWNRTRGNTWRIFWGIVITTVPPILAAEIVLLIFLGFPNPGTLANGAFIGRWIITSVIFTGYYLLILPISIGFLSHSYRHFVQAGVDQSAI